MGVREDRDSAEVVRKYNKGSKDREVRQGAEWV